MSLQRGDGQVYLAVLGGTGVRIKTIDVFIVWMCSLNLEFLISSGFVYDYRFTRFTFLYCQTFKMNAVIHHSITKTFLLIVSTAFYNNFIIPGF